MCGPLIDWNGNGRIDPADIAISLAIAEEEEMSDEDDEEQEWTMKQLKDKEYEEFQASYEADNEKLSKDIADFNERTRSATNGFPTNEEFQQKRQELLARQSEMSTRYNQLVSLVNELNREVNEYNTNVLRNREYEKVMNSHAKPTSEAE